MNDLKAQLREIQSNSFKELTDDGKVKLVEDMIAEIGNPDPELRDRLIYKTFCDLIMGDHLSDDLKVKTLETCMDDHHLFYEIGEEDTDTVFSRSFSALVVALLLWGDAKDRFLPDVLVKEASERAAEYLLYERDVRGQVPEKGWAHAVAHGSDLLATAAHHPLTQLELFYPKCLEALKGCILRESGVYTDNEEERLIQVIDAMINKGFDADQLHEWVTLLWSEVESKKEDGWNAYYQLRTNVQNFLKVLYFYLKSRGTGESSVKKIEQHLIEDYKTLYQIK